MGGALQAPWRSKWLLILLGVGFVVWEVARAVHILPPYTTRNPRWLVILAPTVVLAASWKDRGAELLGGAILAATVFIHFNRTELPLGAWSGLVIGICGVCLVVLGARVSQSEEQRRQEIRFLGAFVVTLLCAFLVVVIAGLVGLV